MGTGFSQESQLRGIDVLAASTDLALPSRHTSINLLASQHFKRAVLPIIALMIMALLVTFADRPVAAYFKTDADPAVVAFFRWISPAGKPDAYLVVCLITYFANRSLFIRFAHRPVSALFCRLSDMALYIVSAIAVGGVAVTLAKYVVGRARPRQWFEMGEYGFAPLSFDMDFNSFPSGHAQVIWMIMVAVGLMVPRLKAACFLFALVVSASRIAISAHFVSDVFAGALLGAGVATLLKHTVFGWLSPFDLTGLSIPVFARQRRSAGIDLPRAG